MWFPAPRIDPLRRLAETLLIAAIGGGLAGLTGVPAAWLSGSMLFVAAAAVIGRPMFVPGSLARGLFALMGMSLGSVVTPQTVHGMGAYPVSIAVLAAAMLGIMAATAFYLHPARCPRSWCCRLSRVPTFAASPSFKPCASLS
jgi:uncharacterized membrane protein AbrB (regulator of aidB expression)